MIAALLLTALAPVQPSAGVAPTQDAGRISPADQATLALARHRGALLYAYDRAAKLGTDDMLTLDHDATARAGGWIVDGPVDAPELVFYDHDSAAPHIIYTARFDHSRLVASHLTAPGEAPALSASRRTLIAARAAAVVVFQATPATLCAPAPADTVVLPPEHDGDPTLVYFLTPQTAAGAYPVGGHYSVAVTRDGKAGSIRRFADTCLDMRPPKDADFFIVTHPLDPVPTELHVFTSLAAHLPLAVVTPNNRFWIVNGDAVILARTLG